MTLTPEGIYTGIIIGATEPNQSRTSPHLCYFMWEVKLEDFEKPVLINFVGTVNAVVFMYRRRSKFIGDTVKVRVSHRDVTGKTCLDVRILD